MKYTVMIPAAGSGKRMGAGYNKLFLEIGRQPILAHTLSVFERDPFCEQIILAVKPQERMTIKQLLQQYNITKVRTMVDGGGERQHSVFACLEAYKGSGVVLVHDAARPFVEHHVIHRLVETAATYGAAIAGVPAKDTMKLAEQDVVKGTVDRSQLWVIQTPQAFRFELLREAALKAQTDGFLGTDESMLVERLGHPIKIVRSTYNNVKITTTEDLLFGEFILKQQLQEEK